MQMNWKVRIKNKAFWLALIPAIALVVQAAMALFGYSINLETMVGKIQVLIDAIFALLAILGIIVDPTTEGIGDSRRAMSYDYPWVDIPDDQEESEEKEG